MSELMWEKGNLSKHPSLPRGCRSRSRPSVSKANLGTPRLILTSAPNHLFLFIIIFPFGVDLKHVYDQFQENNWTWTIGNWKHWQGKTEALGISLFIRMFHCWFWPGSLPDCCGYRSSSDRISYKFPMTDKSILRAVAKCWQNLCVIFLLEPFSLSEAEKALCVWSERRSDSIASTSRPWDSVCCWRLIILAKVGTRMESRGGGRWPGYTWLAFLRTWETWTWESFIPRQRQWKLFKVF